MLVMTFLIGTLFFFPRYFRLTFASLRSNSSEENVPRMIKEEKTDRRKIMHDYKEKQCA